jgi:phosphoglycolate phosphatase
VASLIVFDLDGTLVDSRRDLADSANALIAERGGEPLPVDDIAAMVGEGAAMLVRRALRAAGVGRDDVDVALARFLDLYDERLLAHTELYAGTREILEALAGRAHVAVLTNKPQRHTERLLAGLGVRACFRWVIGGDTAHGRKPDPAGLRWLMFAAGVAAADTVMVGDSSIDLRTAHAAGVRCCLVRYGFGFPSTAGARTGEEVLIDEPSQLMRLV